MTSIIKFSLTELTTLVSDKKSCIEKRQVRQKLALQPWCLGNLVDSIKSVLDYKIGKYDELYSGILLSYKNLKIMENLGAIKNDCSEITVEIQADYFIFRPHIGALLRGIVNKKSVTHLGIIVHRVFNVVIPRPTNNNDMRWIGTTITEGQHVVFRIVMLDLFGALPYIRGELDERYLLEQEDLTLKEIKSRLLVNHVHFENTKPRPPKIKPLVKTETEIKVKQEKCFEDVKVKQESYNKNDQDIMSKDPAGKKGPAKRLSLRPRRSVASKNYVDDDKITDEECTEDETSHVQHESNCSKSSFDKVSTPRTPKSTKKKALRTEDYIDGDEKAIGNRNGDYFDKALSSKSTPSRKMKVADNSDDASSKASKLKRKLDKSSSSERECKRKRNV